MKRIVAVLVALLGLALVKPAAAATNEVVFSSSHTATADTSAVISPGRTYLYRVIVSSAGTGGTPLITLLNSAGTTLGVIDGTVKGTYLYDVYLSTGLSYTTAGTTPPQVSFLYKRPGADLGTSGLVNYSVFNSTGVYTTRNIRAGRMVLKRILVTKAGTVPSAVTVYDTNGATGKIIDLINTEAISQTDYNVYVSSGLTYTSTGNPNVTFVYSNSR